MILSYPLLITLRSPLFSCLSSLLSFPLSSLSFLCRLATWVRQLKETSWLPASPADIGGERGEGRGRANRQQVLRPCEVRLESPSSLSRSLTDAERSMPQAMISQQVMGITLSSTSSFTLYPLSYQLCPLLSTLYPLPSTPYSLPSTLYPLP